MRKLLTLVLIAGALWSGYWFVGKTAKFKVMTTWLDARRAAGWTVDYSDFRVVGYPNRFDSRFTDLDISDPVSGIGWAAPLFNILALSYQPNHIIAAFAHHQTISLPRETVSIDSHDMLASVVFEPDSKLAVRRINLRAFDLTVNSTLGWRSGAKSFSLSTRPSAVSTHAHEIEIDASGITPAKQIRQNLDPKGQLPDAIDKISIDLVLGFSAPWDRVAIESGVPEVTTIDISHLSFGWGKLGFGASGKLTVAQNGVISGKIGLKLKNWRAALDLLRSTGAIDVKLADTIEKTVAILNIAAANPDDLKIPLTLARGSMSLGPIPMGPAPMFIRP